MDKTKNFSRAGLTKLLLYMAMAAALIGVTPNTYAAINEFNAGMLNSGTEAFDADDNPGHDSGKGNDVIRSADSATYRVAYSLTSTDTGSLITLDLTGKIVFPGGYTGTSSGAYFDPVRLPANCENVTTPLSSEPPPAGESGVSSDGLKVWCAIPSATSAENIDFITNIAPDAPNGMTMQAPDITYESDNNPIDTTPGVLNDAVTYYGLPDLRVSAAPRWQVGKNTGNHYIFSGFIPGSGPSGEDGYVFGYNIAVYATGSRKGLEALAPNFSITENFSDGDMPNAQLVTWDMTVPGFAASDFSAATGANGCGNWNNDFHALGNHIDNAFYYTRDRGTSASTEDYAVAKGGQCDAAAVDNVTKTATLNLTGVDSSLNHYPTRRGRGGEAGTLVNPNDLDSPTNQWWISSKVVAIWVPSTDLTPDATETFTNTVTLANATSVTGQANPLSTDSSDTSITAVTTSGDFGKYYSPMEQQWDIPAGFTFAKRDDSILGDSQIKDAVSGNLVSARLNIRNSGVTALSGHVCEKIDNTRLTFFDARSYIKPNSTTKVYDADTGIHDRYLAGTTATVIDWQLGVDGNNISGGTWNNFDTVDPNTEIEIYSEPDNLSSAHRTATCEDGDATWYNSVNDLIAAGRSLSEVTRVRGKYNNLQGGMYILSFIPLRVNQQYAYDANDQSSGVPNRTIVAGTAVNNTYIPNQAYMDYGSGNKQSARLIRIRDNEYVSVTKMAADPAETENESVFAGSLVNYQLQINATSSISEHATTIRVWDVFPQYMSYVPGTTQLGGAVIADPTCFADGVTPPAPAPFAANSVEAGYTACYWDISATAKLLDVGDPAGNLPLLTFQGYISPTAPNMTAILNATAVDSTNNAYADAIYQNAGAAFRCAKNRRCGFSSYKLFINTTQGVVLNKVVDKGVIPVNDSYSYSLFYTALGSNLQGLRILDVLPYSGDLRGSNYNGSIDLTGPIAKPVADTGIPATIADNDIIIFYTSNTPANINQDPYDSGHNLTGTGSNSAITTNWCTETQVGTLAACPANFTDVTGILALPQGSGDQTVDAGDMFELIVPIQTNVNVANDRYDNAFIADSPGLTARRPGSNIVNTVVKAADLVMTKQATNATIASGDNGEFVLNVSNNSIANNPDVGPLFAVPVPTVTVSDDLPTGMTAQLPITATDWDCIASTSTKVNCTYTGTLPVASGSPVGGAITVTVSAPAVGTYTNTASVTLTGQAEFDSSNNSATAQLVIVASQLITAIDDTYTTVVDMPVAITPLANDTTNSGTTITEINSVALTNSPQTISVPNGNVEIDAGGNLTFIPDPGYIGSAVFSYTISDGTNTATANITITIVSSVAPNNKVRIPATSIWSLLILIGLISLFARYYRLRR